MSETTVYTLLSIAAFCATILYFVTNLYLFQRTSRSHSAISGSTVNTVRMVSTIALGLLFATFSVISPQFGQSLAACFIIAFVLVLIVLIAVINMLILLSPAIIAGYVGYMVLPEGVKKMAGSFTVKALRAAQGFKQGVVKAMSEVTDSATMDMKIAQDRMEKMKRQEEEKQSAKDREVEFEDLKNRDSAVRSQFVDYITKPQLRNNYPEMQNTMTNDDVRSFFALLNEMPEVRHECRDKSESSIIRYRSAVTLFEQEFASLEEKYGQKSSQ